MNGGVNMNVDGISSQMVGTPAANGNSEMGKQEFLQLLVAQMKNQDPINPMDGSQMASQLAQFNSVEQLINVNDGLAELKESQQIMSMGLTNSLAAALTGKQVKALSNQIQLPESGSADFEFKLANSAEEVEVIIRSESGAEVYRTTMKSVMAGEHEFGWDGKNNAGKDMEKGVYSVEVVPKNGDSTGHALTFITGVAQRVQFSSDGVYLMLDDVSVAIGNIEEVGRAEGD